MKKNSLNPLAVIVTVLTTIVALVIAIVLKNHVFDGMTRWSNLIFWIIFAGLAALGTILSAKNLNKDRKGGRRKW